MPTTPKKKVSTTAPSVKREAVGSNINQPASPAGAGWSNAQKGELFEHVCKIGETDWASAVAGKTAQQSREQWKKTIYPAIKRQYGW